MLHRLLLRGLAGSFVNPVSAFHGFLAYNDTTQTVYDRQMIAMVLDQNEFDTEGMHYTSAAALTGTVSKTAGSSALSGSSTVFTSELSVGQIIAIQKTLTGSVTITNGSTTVSGSGTAFLTECAVGQMLNVGAVGGNTLWIKTIASDTSMTVDHAEQNVSPNPYTGTGYATELCAIAVIGSNTSATLYNAAQTSASGLTGTRVSYAACIKTAGYWDFYGYLTVGLQPAQDSPPSVLVNGLAVRGAANIIWANQATGVPPTGIYRMLPRHFDVGDIIIPIVYWDNDGGAPGSSTVGGNTPYTETVFGGFLIGE